MKDILIAIATIESRLNNAISLANKFSSFDVAVSVYCQGNKVGQDHIDGTNIIYLNSIGVTKSRNYAIDDCCLPYIWFMDDDVDIVENEVVKTIQDIKSTTSTIMLTRVVNENLKLRKKYPSSSCVKTRDLLRVGTIEIIAN
ncbi:TPA: hypothetical protein LR347_004765, partial [Enterobacter hormaechei]|nr:hypothetical protein [Enterobacter hormaechei]